MPNNESGRTLQSPQETIMSLIMGASVTQFIGIAVNLGIPNILKEKTLTSTDIATQCDTRQEETYRFLRGLSCIGILNEHAERAFSLTPVGMWLRSDIPGSFDALTMMHSAVWSGDVYANLEHTLKTGENAFRKTYSCSMFEWLTQHPESEAIFGRAMSTYSGMEVAMVIETYDFTGSQCIVDIGGGHGMLLAAILKESPDAHGILFDMKEVVEHAQLHLNDTDISPRLTCVGGDFFDEIPTGGNVYLLKHILHDWDNHRASQILKNVAAAMPQKARLLVIEQGITPPGIPGPGKMLDLSMMTLTEGGMERTPEQHKALFESAGLTYTQTIYTKGPITLFEAVLA